MAGRRKAGTNGNGANIGYEEKLWAAADKLRGHMDASEYKHVVLGLIFLKYISDSFQERFEAIQAEDYSDAEDRDEYTAENVFWLPPEARWQAIRDRAKDSSIGQVIDGAMLAIEKENPRLRGVLPRNYGRPDLDKQRLGEVVDLISAVGVGGAENTAVDALGRVYEYFLGRFASAEGKAGGEFYTARCVVQVMVAMLEPYKGRVYDPCCGSGGMFVQSERFVEEHGGKVGDIAIYGQESNPTTWRLARMNLAIRGIDADLGPHHADTFRNDLHKDLRADFILANPPFNMSDWGGDQLKDDVRWKYGAPPAGNANYAWMQHMIHHLAPAGALGLVLANGSMSSNQSGEGEIRRAIVEADLVDCMIALPGQLFYTTTIPVCLWFLRKKKPEHRRGQTLFLDARKMGYMEDRVHRNLSDEDIARIADTYHAWRGVAEGPHGEDPRRGTTPTGPEAYQDTPGFCRSATLEEIASHGYVLTPGRYVGAAEEEDDDGEPFDEKMARLTATLFEQFEEGRKLEKAIRANLEGLGYGS